jgi:hypothetical protein
MAYHVALIISFIYVMQECKKSWEVVYFFSRRGIPWPGDVHNPLLQTLDFKQFTYKDHIGSIQGRSFTMKLQPILPNIGTTEHPHRGNYLYIETFCIILETTRKKLLGFQKIEWWRPGLRSTQHGRVPYLTISIYARCKCRHDYLHREWLGVDGIQPTHDYWVRVDIHRSRCYASRRLLPE